MPKIRVHQIHVQGTAYDLQLYYTSASGFYFKNFPLGPQLKTLEKYSFENTNSTEQELIRALDLAIVQYERECSVSEKIIRVRVYTGRLVEWTKTSEGGYSKSGKSLSKSLKQEHGLAFDYRIMYKVTNGRVTYWDSDEAGNKLHKTPERVPDKEDGAIDIPYSEEAVQLLEGAATTLNEVAAKFMNFFHKPDFLESLAAGSGFLKLPPKTDPSQ